MSEAKKGIFSPKARLILAAVLFAGWIGYLGSLAIRTAHPIIISRPQLLISNLDVIAKVAEGGDGRPVREVEIVEVHWPNAAKAFEGKSIAVANLPSADGWEGPGEYILLLDNRNDSYDVAAIPHSPGFDPKDEVIRIYKATHDARCQLASIPKN